MQILLDIFNFIVANWMAILAAVVGLLNAVIVICLMIPGDQPEKTLKQIVEFLSKISRK